ncbi:MAG: hypothetical protein WKF77_00925 [Planctomycetaceae bacterium]
MSGALQWLGDTDRDTTQEYLFRFGLAGDKSLIGDLNGDGYDDVVAVRVNGGFLDWYVHYATPGATPYPTNDSTVSVNASFTFGLSTDIPQIGDFNGDGRADVTAVRAGGGTFTWYVHDADAGANPYPLHPGTGAGQPVDHTYTFGSDLAIPVVGNWDNNGNDNLGVVEDTGAIPSNPADWSLDTNFAGAAEITLEYGLQNDQFIVGKWADRIWDGGALTSNWSDVNNWDSNILPASGDDVLIGDLSGNQIISLGTTTTVASVTALENVAFTAGTFTTTQLSTYRAGVTLSGATFSPNFGADIYGSSTWSAGNILGSGSGAIALHGTMVFSGVSNRSAQNTTIFNYGTFTQTDGLFDLNSTLFANESLYQLQGVGSSTSIRTFGTGAFSNGSSGSAVFADTMTGIHGVEGKFYNYGSATFTVASGTFQFPHGAAHAGAFSVSTGATLQFQTGTTDFNSGATFSGGGTVKFLSGTMNVNSDITIPKLENSATISVAAGKTLSAPSPTLSGGTITGSGTLAISGTTVIATSATLSGNVTNSGTVNVSGAAQILLNSPGVLTNSAGGTIALTTSSNSGITGGGQLNNSGLINSTGTAGIAVNNYNNKSGGQIRALSGTLALPSSGIHAGTFTAMPGATMAIQGGTMTLNAGTSFGGGGTIALNGGTFNVMDNISGTNLQLSFNLNYMNIAASKTLTLTGNNSITGANFNSGGATGTLRNTGTLTVSGGVGLVLGSFNNAGVLNLTTGSSVFTLSPGAVVTNEVGATLDIQSTGGFEGASGSFVNNGSLLRTGGSGTSPINTPFTGSGTINNSSSGTLDFQRASTFSNSITTANGATTRFGNSFVFNFNTGTSLPGTGTVEFANGTFNINDNLTTAANVLLSSSSGTVSVSAGKTFTLSSAGNSFTAAAGISGAGTVRNTGTISIGASAPVISGKFANAGTVNHTGTASLSVTGNFTNEATGVYEITTSTGGLNVSGGASSFILNQGLIRRSTGTGAFNFNASNVGTPTVENDGTIEFQTVQRHGRGRRTRQWNI